MARRQLVVLLFAVLALGGCSGEVEGGPDPSSAGELLLGISISDGEVGSVEILGQYDVGVLRSLGRPGPTGDLHVSVLDTEGRLVGEGRLHDPRIVFADDFMDSGLRGEQAVSDLAESFVIVPAPPGGRGTVVFTLTSQDGADLTTEFEIDLSDGTATRVEIAKDAHLVHLLGPRDPDDAVVIVFFPNGFGMDQMDSFEAFVRGVATSTASRDWYQRHRHQLSFWAMRESAVDEMAPPDCTMAWDPVGGGRLWTRAYVEAALRRYGDTVTSPDVVVVVTNEACRAFALPGTVLMDNVEPRDTVLAHELGHAMGILMDEYEVWPCVDAYANVVPVGSTRWQCVEAGAPYQAACPDGSLIGAAHDVPGCSVAWTSPCPTCMMRDADTGFCPVCSAFMDANLARILGSRIAETCNGVDDDIDLRVDEGCECEPTACTPTAEVCDGADNDCDDEVDEGCSCTDGETGPCGSDVGACRPGSQRCTGGAWGACEGERGPSDEVCDGADNDCDGATDEGSVCGGVCAGPGSSSVAFEVASGGTYVYPLAGGTGSWTYNEVAPTTDVTVLTWRASAPAGCAINRITLDLPTSPPDDPDRGCAVPGNCANRRTSSARYVVTTDAGPSTQGVDQAAAGSTATITFAPTSSVTVRLGDVTGDSRRGETYLVFHRATFFWE